MSFLCKWFGWGCPKPIPTPIPVPTDPEFKAIAIVVSSAAGPIPGAAVTLDGNPNHYPLTNGDGYTIVNNVPYPLTASQLSVSANGYLDYSVHVDLPLHNDTLNVTMVASKLPLPARPTRDQVCAVKNQLQGISIKDHHLFDPEIVDFSPEDRAVAYAAHRALGDTHINLSLDMSGLGGLAKRKSIIREAITSGGLTGVLLMCMGDGNDAGEGDHDSGALNYSWLMANFDAIVDFMEAGPDGEDLTPWIVFCPGYDGVIPAWQPFTRVNNFIRVARKRLDRLSWGSGYLALELAAGYATWSGEQNDWATTDGQAVDVILQEFPIEWGPPAAPPANLLTSDGSDWSPSATNDQRNPWTQIWIVQRMLGPLYRRPAMQPSNYDAHVPYHLGGGTPRGRFFYICWERTTYLWCRQNCDISVVNQQTQVVKDLGAEFY